MKPITCTILQDNQLMRLSCNELTEKMTHIHSQMTEVCNTAYYERLRDNMKPKRYRRISHSGIECPTLDDIEKELANLSFIGTQTISANQLLKERTEVWEGLNQFNEKVESFREEEANRQNQIEFDAKLQEVNDYISGEEHVIESRWNMALSDLKLPFDLNLQLEYFQKSHSAVVDAILPADLNMPYVKTVFHSRGSTVKDKLQKEVAQDESECKIGLVFLIANRSFAITPSLKYMTVKLWSSGKSFGEMAIDFERDRFRSQVSTSIIPSSQFYNWAHVSDERIVRDALTFNHIEFHKFEQRCEGLKSFRNAASGTISTPQDLVKSTTCELSLVDAQLVFDNIANNDEIGEAIIKAKRQGKQTVTLPARYMGLLKEIQSSK